MAVVKENQGQKKLGRVFYASHDSGNFMPGSRTWYNNLYLSLCDIADEVIRFDYDLEEIAKHQDHTRPENKEIIAYHKRKIEKKLIEQLGREHKKEPIAIFFSYFASSYCSPEVIRQISEMGILTVNWFCNASYQFYLVEDIAPAYDFCLVPEKFRLEDYSKKGARPIYCQEAANPGFYKPLTTEQDIDLSFVGSRYADRPAYLNALYDSGISVQVWGEGWKKKTKSIKDLLRPIYHSLKGVQGLRGNAVGSSLSDEQMVEVFNRSRINLGFSKCWTGSGDEVVKQLRLRDFEVPMSGGFYLTEYSDELPDFFVPDKEVVCFTTIAECVEKAKYYLAHPQEREEIRWAGHRRAMKDHSWQKRLSEAFAQMGVAA